MSLSLSTEIGPATIVPDVGFLYSKLILIYVYLIFYRIIYFINYGGVKLGVVVTVGVGVTVGVSVFVGVTVGVSVLVGV